MEKYSYHIARIMLGNPEGPLPKKLTDAIDNHDKLIALACESNSDGEGSLRSRQVIAHLVWLHQNNLLPRCFPSILKKV